MKLLVALSALMAVASASSIAYYATPYYRTYPYVYGTHSSSVLTPVQQQYHSQDELGQYSYGYSDPLSTKQEVRSLDGVTRGSYSYRDAEGKLQTVDYTADAGGFRVAATNLPRPVPLPEFRPQEAPTPVVDSVEVAAARKAHLAAHQEANLRLAEVQAAESATATQSAGAAQSGVDTESVTVDASIRSVELPRPVSDEPAVAAAKAEHLKRVGYEQLRNEILSEPAVVRTSLPIAYQPAVIPSVYSYNFPFNSRFLAHGFYY